MSEARQRDVQRARHLRWFLALALVFILGVGLVLFYLLTLATDHRAVQPQTYTHLLVLNLGVAAVLAGVLVWLALRLLVRLRRRRFGSVLLLKLAAIFGLVGVVPGCTDLPGVVPVREPGHRNLVRCPGRDGLARRSRTRAHRARYRECRLGDQDAHAGGRNRQQL
jgi:hypothetical protein